ncbi:MAG: hypothetical protein OSB45_11370, partial [Pseudomonadales bacterium]|nr:hypothetical protein [Pseudomonadales bacterium]
AGCQEPRSRAKYTYPWSENLKALVSSVTSIFLNCASSVVMDSGNIGLISITVGSRPRASL